MKTSLFYSSYFRRSHVAPTGPLSFSLGTALATAATRTLGLARQIAGICADNKAEDVVILSLDGVSDMADYFVIASGTSDTHVRSTAQHVMDALAPRGEKPAHEEGVAQGRWALLDYVDVVVHIFHPTLRSYYQLERLWGDAKVIPVVPQGASA